MTAGTLSGLEWKPGDIPVSVQFDDPYFSLGNGLAETRHVFLAGNDLPGRFRDGFSIAELGFGTGLNFLATFIALRDAGVPGKVQFTSFEGYPITAAEIERALRAFPEAHAVAGPYLAQWQAQEHVMSGARVIELPGLKAEILIGDVAQRLPAWEGRADAWYLDGFSPAKNPGMWSEEIMAEVGAHTAPGGTFATYTAAGHVRRSLAAAGFTVERAPGFGYKRHMSRGRRD